MRGRATKKKKKKGGGNRSSLHVGGIFWEGGEKKGASPAFFTFAKKKVLITCETRHRKRLRGGSAFFQAFHRVRGCISFLPLGKVLATKGANLLLARKGREGKIFLLLGRKIPHYPRVGGETAVRTLWRKRSFPPERGEHPP